ncbi:VOC family protein [Cellulomonas sp. McL0617]|uniref:VOC family protein n=1 Tax=Cellulomonas sp. McL0617 TaxID=3415675 RepID=UPI003CEAA2C0
MPLLGHGKVCHIALPATDVEASAAFYESVFGWRMHRDGGRITFDDSVDEVSGHFDPRLAPAGPGLLVYLMVDDLHDALARLVAAGAAVVEPPGADPGELTARFRDPGGNVLGVYQEPPQP